MIIKLNLAFSIAQYCIFQRDEFHASDLHGYFEKSRPAYLYCILSKNRISVNPKSVGFTDNKIKVELLIQDRDRLIKETIIIDHEYKDLESVKVISEFPHNEFEIRDELESILIKAKTAYIVELDEIYEQINHKALLDYEILYIGQSVLSEDNVPVLERISSHETFQKILEDYNRSNPDKELFSCFLSFKQDALIDIPEEILDSERQEFNEKFQQIYLKSTLREVKQNVSLIEAALINYFKPKYNSKFVSIPPSKKHISFKGVAQMNLDHIYLMFGIEDFKPRFYTEKVGRKADYQIEYEFS